MQGEDFWVGLDVGADELVACMVDAEGNVRVEEAMPTCPLRVSVFMEEHAGDRAPIGIEAGSSCLALTRKLRQAGFRVHAFDTRQVSKFLAIRQNKTDANDARGIADVVRMGRGVVAEVYIKSAECQQLRSKLAIRQKLVRHRIAGESAIRSAFRLNSGRLDRCFSAVDLRRKVTAELERIRDVEGIDLIDDVMPLLSICEATRKHLEVADRKLNKLAQRHPICGRFMEIPGVGFLTALSVYSAIENPSRFVRNEDAGAYFGLVPRVRQSGQSIHRLGISKMGNTMTRSHLITAAGVLMRLKNADCDLQDWAKALAARADNRRARTALARKLAVTMLSMWRSGDPFKARSLAGPLDP